MASINKMLRFKSVDEHGRGSGAQRSNAKVRANRGARINSIGDDVVGCVGSLINSFMPSATGWRSP